MVSICILKKQAPVCFCSVVTANVFTSWADEVS